MHRLQFYHSEHLWMVGRIIRVFQATNGSVCCCYNVVHVMRYFPVALAARSNVFLSLALIDNLYARRKVAHGEVALGARRGTIRRRRRYYDDRI